MELVLPFRDLQSLISDGKAPDSDPKNRAWMEKDPKGNAVIALLLSDEYLEHVQVAILLLQFGKRFLIYFKVNH